MRLWHSELIEVLPNKQLVSQWRELLAIKGAIIKKGTPNHLLVNKVLDCDIQAFRDYANLIYHEMITRSMKPSRIKYMELMDFDSELFLGIFSKYEEYWFNKRYLRQCYYNLQEKADCGGLTISEWTKIQNKFGSEV